MLVDIGLFIGVVILSWLVVSVLDLLIFWL